MVELLGPVLHVGDSAPNCTLSDGTHLFELRGRPVVLAFASDEWNPAHAYQSEIFARLSAEFAGGAAFVDASTDDWHSLDSRGDLAAQFGVTARRALFLLDEHGVLCWKIEVEPGQTIHPGEVLAALESLNVPSSPGGRLSRRAFLTATLAAAAVLTLPFPPGRRGGDTHYDTEDRFA